MTADLVTVCPDCDSAMIKRRSPRAGTDREGDPDAKWRCSDCGHRFDEPDERPPRDDGPGAGSKGLSKLLANPEVTSIEDARAAARGGDS